MEKKLMKLKWKNGFPTKKGVYCIRFHDFLGFNDLILKYNNKNYFTIFGPGGSTDYIDDPEWGFTPENFLSAAHSFSYASIPKTKKWEKFDTLKDYKTDLFWVKPKRTKNIGIALKTGDIHITIIWSNHPQENYCCGGWLDDNYMICPIYRE